MDLSPRPAGRSSSSALDFRYRRSAVAALLDEVQKAVGTVTVNATDYDTLMVITLHCLIKYRSANVQTAGSSRSSIVQSKTQAITIAISH